MTRIVEYLASLFPILAMTTLKATALSLFTVIALTRARNSLNAANRVRIACAALISIPILAAGILPNAWNVFQDEPPVSADTGHVTQTSILNTALALAASENIEPINPTTQKKALTGPDFMLRLSSPISAIVSLAWLCISLFLLTRLFSVRLRLARYISSLHRVTDGAWFELLRTNWPSMGHGPMPILLDDPASCPFVARSAGKTYMVIPAADPDWTGQDKHAAVMHECAHATRRDPSIMLILEAISCVAWHIPFVRALVTIVERDREEACDELALKHGVDPRELASLLLELRTPFPDSLVPGAQGVRGKNSIERRITMIMKRHERSAGTSRRALVRISVLLAACAISLYALPQIFAEEKPALPAEPMVETISLSSQDTLNPMGTVQLSLPLAALPEALPVEGARWHMTFGFGKQIHPFTKKDYFHSGIDLSEYTSGSPAFATIDGTIAAAAYDRDWGNYVVIQNDNMIVFYSHLEKLKATTGAKTTAGTVIGTVGNTGITTGPHLHYEIRLLERGEEPVSAKTGKPELGGTAIDPRPLLSMGGLSL